VPAVPGARRDVASRAGSLGATLAVVADGSELRRAVPLPGEAAEPDDGGPDLAPEDADPS
jgi:hypothetical protein